MSFSNPKFTIPRQSVVGMEGMFAKMWDPPTDSPATPDRVLPTNPVPEVMLAAGFQNIVSVPHTVQRDLLHGLDIPSWDDLKKLKFMVFRDADNPATSSGNYPGATIRVPRGVIFHADSQGHGPPPHTIHWHGIEPTPINDGVGHCSMEIGHYTYQFQPNFIGFYFCHCHRNTVQHFEFGLYQALLIEPPDAYFASIANLNQDGSAPETVILNNIPIGHCRDGKRRIAANVASVLVPDGPVAALHHGVINDGTLTDLSSMFPGFNNRPIDALDDQWTGDSGLKFTTDPHAMTVPYDVEALWVVDDRDSVWSDLAPNARATYPSQGDTPGVNDNFHGNAGGVVGPGDFFAFNDFHADYWFVTGVPVPAARIDKGGTGVGTIPAGIVVPPELNSGVSGTQVSIEATVGDTILVRCLDAAYNNAEITFPVDVVIIAWDGRSLGIPPYTQYNHAYLVPSGTPIHISVARRFDALIRAASPIEDFATVKFIDTRGENVAGFEQVLMTAQIPLHINAVAAGSSISGTVTDAAGTPLAGVTVMLTGAANKTAVTDASGDYNFAGLADDNYTVTPSRAGYRFVPRRRNVTVKGADLANRNFRGIAR